MITNMITMLESLEVLVAN